MQGPEGVKATEAELEGGSPGQGSGTRGALNAVFDATELLHLAGPHALECSPLSQPVCVPKAPSLDG